MAALPRQASPLLSSISSTLRTRNSFLKSAGKNYSGKHVLEKETTKQISFNHQIVVLNQSLSTDSNHPLRLTMSKEHFSLNRNSQVIGPCIMQQAQDLCGTDQVGAVGKRMLQSTLAFLGQFCLRLRSRAL